jgi:hypothetical protein
MAAQAQLGAQQGGHQGEGQNGGFRQPRWNADSPGDEGDEFDADIGGEIRAGGMEMRGSQDRERHEGNREHHGGPRREHGRHGGNGAEGARERDANGADQPETHSGDETAPDQVS